MTQSGWDWFDPDGAALTAADSDHWQACFETDAGQAVLADLERHFLQSALGPDASDKAIWMREGKRALVLQIKRLAERSAVD